MIAEGFATAASIREATGLPVVIAFDCGNLGPVAKAIRSWLPLACIAIAADDDHSTEGNPGLSKARDAAELIGAALAVPTFLETEPRRATSTTWPRSAGLSALQKSSGPPSQNRRGGWQRSAARAGSATGAQSAGGSRDLGARPRLGKAADRCGRRLNKKHFVVTVGGQTVIATLAHDDALKRELLVFSQSATSSSATGTGTTLSATQKGSKIWKGLGEVARTPGSTHL